MDEYQQVLKEYANGYFTSLRLADGLELTTLEGVQHTVIVTVDGWKTTDQDAVFPTFESLAMDLSDEFKQRWWDEVNKRLEH